MASPYQIAAADYLAAGWSPIPLPPKSKWPVPDKPTSFTGAAGAWVTEDQLRAWGKPKGRFEAGKASFAVGNVALRLARDFDGSGFDVIGIDADMYGEKAGASTLEAAESAWGPLPLTWVSSSRPLREGSGIRLYRVPTGLSWPGQLPQGGGVELVRWDHRYCVAPPSIHDKTGEEYTWRQEVEEDRDGEPVVSMQEVEGEIPGPAELPELPAAWVEGLTSGRAFVERGDRVELSPQEVRDWLLARGQADPCDVMRKTLSRGLAAVRKAGDDGGAHDAARDAAWGLIGDAAAGHEGIRHALTKLKAAFKKAVADRRPDTWEGEWARILNRGVEKVAAEGEPADEDNCAAIAEGRPTGSGGSGTGSALFDYVRTDIGNGDRFLTKYGDDVRYCPELGGWQVWDDRDNLWVNDIESLRVLEWAAGVVRLMEDEAEYIEDVKQKATFIKFARSSGSQGKLRAMVDQARRERVTVRATDFDADPRMVNCPNGVLELTPSGVRFRPTRREDYFRLTTGVAYRPEAAHGAWTKFLDRFLPTPEEQLWAQKLVAYSMLGANPARVLVIAKGPTTSGKSTFAEAIMGALGAYAGGFGLTLFRDNQDERPRVDIVQALPRRAIFAEESSKEWHLHADQVKRATGGSRWGARGMYGKTYVERVPAFTPWVVTNNTPTVLGADAAFRKRLRAVPFAVQVDSAQENVGYKELLAVGEVREAILAWAVAGWAAYLEDETLTDMPHAAAELAMKIGNELSEFDECLAEICDFGPEYRAEVDALYRSYELWWNQNADEKKVLSKNAFSRELTGKGYGKSQERNDGRTRRFRTGLRLSEEWANLQKSG